MSCLCETYHQDDPARACPCDRFVYPPPLNIPAGLSELPRQFAVFPDFRRAMLAAIRDQDAQNPLTDWRARGTDDLGIMLLEMWAYVCDSISFYDKIIAQEAYLRTARRRPSVRRLVDLLGYLPIPAVAARVELAAFGEGRKLVTLPAGTAFRSKGFDGEAPQVFELDRAARIHPLANSWKVAAPNPGIVATTDPRSLLIQPTAEIVEGTRLLLLDSADESQNQVARVATVMPFRGADERNYTQVTFAHDLTLAAGTALANLTIYVPTQRASLYTLTGDSIQSAAGRTTLTLDKQYGQLQAGEYVLVSSGTEARWYRLHDVKDTMRAASAASTITINSSTFELRPIQIPVTDIELDTTLDASSRKPSGAANWETAGTPSLAIHYRLIPAGRVVAEAKTQLEAGDPLALTGTIEQPREAFQPERFFLQDKNQVGFLLNGAVQLPQRKLELGQDETKKWTEPLTLPVEAYGNVIEAVRGESVDGEILGSGDASTASQAFKLQKKPLTYQHAPTADNDRGVASTLTVYVDGVRWREVPSFYGRGPEDQVYLVRQDDEGDSIITFGDGTRGQRLPTGTDNIQAWYRFGAGAASPPADSIVQIAKPADGLRNVKNPLPAYGGADEEAADAMQENAPRSILTLGRAVSIQDMEAIALGVPGIRVVQSAWHWDERRQRPVVMIWYVGEAELHATVKQRLRNVSDPSTPFGVRTAEPVGATLSLDVAIDPRYLEANVLAEISDLLLGEEGFLQPEQLRIGQPLFRSRLFETVLRAEGAKGIRGSSWNGAPFGDFARTPGSGRYFAFSTDTVLLNGNPATL